MAKSVNLPNGKKGNFPDDMSWEEIESIVQKQFPPSKMGQKPQENKSFLQKEGEFVQKNINEPVESMIRQGGEMASGLAQGTANIAPGIANLGIKGANLIPGNNIEEFKGFHFAPKTGNAMLGELASFFGPGMLGKINELSSIPKHISSIPSIANAVKKAADVIGKSPLAIQKAMKGLTSKTGKSVGSNALLGAVMTPEDQGLGALLGGTGAGLGEGIGKVSPKIMNKLGLGKKPGEEIIEGLNYLDVAPSVEASKRLGTQLRPSEATRNPYLGGLEGKYPRTREAAKANVQYGMNRTGKEKEAINNLLTTIYDKSTASNNKIRNLYNNAYKWNMRPSLVNQLKEDPIISDAFNEVASNSAWKRKMKGVPENNYAYLDKVRKSIGDKENKLIKLGEKSQSAEYTDARNSLTQLMDKAVPVYEKARAEAQKSIIRSNIEKKLKTSEINGSQFFKKIIRNETKFDDLVKSLKNVPAAQFKLKDMKQAWHSLINIEKPATASYQSEKAINQARGSLQKVLETWNQLTGKKKNLEAVKFIRSDKWVKKLQQAHQSGNKKRLEDVLSDIMGKALPGSFNTIKEGMSE